MIVVAFGVLSVSAKGDAERAMGYRPPLKGGISARRISDAGSSGFLRASAKTALPAKWDAREHGWISPVKDQGDVGTCWAFASYATLETQLLKLGRGLHDFSEKNMVNLHGWESLNPDDGGDYCLAAGYLLRWGGAVVETNDVYAMTVGAWSASPQFAPVVRVQNIIWVPPLDGSQESVDILKTAIMEYGAVGTAMYWSGSYEKNDTYYCPFYNSPNHAVAIVGWDDAYPTNGFRVAPSGEGAWIIKNSWGTDNGDKGYYHISYHDNMVGRSVGTVFIPAGESEEYDAVRGHDVQGPIFDASGADSLVASKHDLQAAVFSAAWNEQLAAVGIWSSIYPNPYEIYVYTNVVRGAASPIAGGALACQLTGTLQHAGFTTIPLTAPVALATGTGFAIVYRQTGAHLSNLVNCFCSGACSPVHEKGNSYFGYYPERGGLASATWFDGKTIVEEDSGNIDPADVSWAASIKAYTRSAAARAGDAPSETDDATAYLADLAATNAVLFAETAGTFGASVGLAGANGRSLWMNWLTGLDPSDPSNADFTVSISFTNNVPCLTWTPDLGERRSYKVLGRASLSSGDEWFPVGADELGSTSARFFKVSIGQNP